MKPLCGWRMPEGEAQAMLAMLDREIAGCTDLPQRRSALVRFQAMLRDDVRAMRGGDGTQPRQ